MSFISGLKTRSRARRSTAETVRRAERVRPYAQNDLLPRLEMVTIAIGDLVLPRRAIRKLDPGHIAEVRASIEAFGFTVPVLLGKGNEVINGAVSVAAARELGLATVPAVRMDHLDEATQDALRVAVNRLGEKGDWDFGELKILFDDLVLKEIPLELSGFTDTEIDQILLDDSDLGPDAGPLAPDPALPGVARLGDLFLLGDHRLLCGDARDAAVIAALMGEERARLLCTDPPYNVKISGNVTTERRREFVMASGELSAEEFATFNRDWIAATLPCLLDGALCAPFIDWRSLTILCNAATTCGLELLNLIVWSKPNGGMGSLYRSAHELLPLFRHGRAPHINNVQLGSNGRNRTNVWIYPSASSVGSDSRRGLKDHPTVKPVALLQDFLLDVTERGDSILDPFTGSGSTISPPSGQGGAPTASSSIHFTWMSRYAVGRRKPDGSLAMRAPAHPSPSSLICVQPRRSPTP